MLAEGIVRVETVVRFVVTDSTDVCGWPIGKGNSGRKKEQVPSQLTKKSSRSGVTRHPKPVGKAY